MRNIREWKRREDEREGDDVVVGTIRLPSKTGVAKMVGTPVCDDNANTTGGVWRRRRKRWRREASSLTG